MLACRQPARDTSFDDPAHASERVRAMVGSCAGVTRALDALVTAQVRGRLLMGLVDEAIASAKCGELRAAVTGKATAHQLARARLDDAKPDVALAHLTTSREIAVRYRRAELLDRMGRASEAARELDGIALDDQAATLQRLVRVSAAVKEHAEQVAADTIKSAPLTEQARLAHRAVADAAPDQLAVLARVDALELVVAAADRIEQEQGPAAVRAARERVIELEPAVADHWDALGRARIAAGDADAALAAWDRAIELAPAQPAFRVTPIRALVLAGQPQRARDRAKALAEVARKAADVELLVAASGGAAAAGEGTLAIELAREAHGKRSGDGRLIALVAQRLAEGGSLRAGVDMYVDLLVCGAHGRAWHRHDVAGKLQALAALHPDVVKAAVTAKRSCETVEPDDLNQYLTALAR